MQTAMVVTWTHPVPGRETKALEYGAEVMDFWGKQAAEGRCSVPELFFSERGEGLWIVKGDRNALMAIHDSADAQLLTMKGQLLLEGFCLDFFTAGDASDEYLGLYGRTAAAIL